MRALALSLAALIAFGVGALAQIAPPQQTTSSSTPVGHWLQAGYEIKAAFFDNAGGAYILLQKGTSAYMCHSSPNQICEKLN